MSVFALVSVAELFTQSSSLFYWLSLNYIVTPLSHLLYIYILASSAMEATKKRNLAQR